MQFGILNLGIVLAYLLATVCIGFLAGRGVDSASEFQLGSRDLPWWALGISVIATYVSALSFLGAPAWAYGDGMAALAIHVNYPIVVFVVVTVFLPFFYNSGATSIYDYLERRFGGRTRSTLSLVFLISQTITSASIVTAASVVITFITGVDVHISIVALTAMVIAYTMVGGLKAVIWTDVMQAGILFVGAAVVFVSLLVVEHPISGALSTLSHAGKLDPIRTKFDFSVAPTIWAGVFAMSLFHITVYGANQMMVQRALAAKNIGDAKKTYMMMGYAGFLIYFLFFSIGALLWVFYKGRPFAQPNEIILDFAYSLHVPGLMGILTAAILSASMSSLSSSFNSLATSSVADFYQRYWVPDASDRHYLIAARGFTMLWGLLSIPIAFAFVGSGGSILERLSQVGSFFVGAQLATFAMGFFSKHTSERGLLFGIAGGFLALAVTAYGVPPLGISAPHIAWPWYVVIGGGSNIAIAWAASMLLDGKKTEWHEMTVPGQRAHFHRSGIPERENGWYRVPGKIDRPAIGLLIYFCCIIVFLLTIQHFA